jgi:hypothetical protein
MRTVRQPMTTAGRLLIADLVLTSRGVRMKGAVQNFTRRSTERQAPGVGYWSAGLAVASTGAEDEGAVPA